METQKALMHTSVHCVGKKNETPCIEKENMRRE